jgi:hypothetical protein
MNHKHLYETDYRGYTCCQICGARPTKEAIVFPAHFNNSKNEVTVFMQLKKKEEKENE